VVLHWWESWWEIASNGHEKAELSPCGPPPLSVECANRTSRPATPARHSESLRAGDASFVERLDFSRFLRSDHKVP